MPSAIAGIRTCCTFPQRLTPHTIIGQVPGRYTQPELGSIPPSPMEKSRSSRTPVKNSGMETPIMATEVAV
jgi:hypothetical protein